MNCDLAAIMAGLNDGSMQQRLLVKNNRKHQRHRTRSHMKLQGIRQVMQSTLLGQFQQQVRFPTSSNPGHNQRFLFTLRLRVGPGSNLGWTLLFQELKFSTEVGFFFCCCYFSVHTSPSTQDVGQTISSVNMTLVSKSAFSVSRLSKRFFSSSWKAVFLSFSLKMSTLLLFWVLIILNLASLFLSIHTFALTILRSLSMSTLVITHIQYLVDCQVWSLSGF